MLAKMAYKIGRAFSSGAKSAPAEFAEVQSLLFSVGGALRILAGTLPHCIDEKSTENTPETSSYPIDDEAGLLVANIASRCQDVLRHLETFVDKYSVLGADAGESDGRRRHWKEDFKKNWKKVVWTKEGGDIVKLKQTLTAHANALNLAVSIMNG